MIASGHSHSHDVPHPHADLPSGISDSIERGALRTQKIAEFLEAHFGSVEIVEMRETDNGKVMFEPAIVVRLDDQEARVGLVDLVVRCSNEALKARVESILDMAMTTVDSLATSFAAAPQDIESGLTTMMDTSTKDIFMNANGKSRPAAPAEGDQLQMPRQDENATTAEQAEPVPPKDDSHDAANQNVGSGDASGSDAEADAEAEDEDDSMLAVIG